MADKRPGFKEHFWSKDDGSPGTIDGLIETMDSIIKKKNAPSGSSDSKRDYASEIDAISEKIQKLVSPALGNKAKDFSIYCSEHYLNKKATLSDSERESKKKFIAEAKGMLGEDVSMMVEGYIFKREQLWGQRIRSKKVPKKVVEPSEARDVESLKKVINLLFQAKDVMEEMAKKEPSWKSNKLKNRKDNKGKPKEPTYTMDDIRKSYKV
jgi:hypothetical protein